MQHCWLPKWANLISEPKCVQEYKLVTVNAVCVAYVKELGSREDRSNSLHLLMWNISVACNQTLLFKYDWILGVLHELYEFRKIILNTCLPDHRWNDFAAIANTYRILQ